MLQALPVESNAQVLAELPLKEPAQVAANLESERERIEHAIPTVVPVREA